MCVYMNMLCKKEERGIEDVKRVHLSGGVDENFYEKWERYV